MLHPSHGRHFTHDGHGLPETVTDFLAARPTRPRLLGLGEPLHGIEAFPRLRNQLLRHLVEHEGYRSVALESDCLAGLVANDHITTGTGSTDEALTRGLTHGFGELAANRELLTWLREHNATRPPAEQVTLHGFDAPTEITGAQSPRSAVLGLHRHLTDHLAPGRVPHGIDTLDELLGEDSAWTDEAAALDPARSIGRSAAARELRVCTDDLIALAEAEAPTLRAASGPAEHERARLFARTARGLLRYHAEMATSSPDRMSRLLSLRDALMAENLIALAEAEADRGPTLVFAHNSHLRPAQAVWRLTELAKTWWGGDAPDEMRWWSAGAHTAARLGSGYAFLATDFSRSIDIPAAPETSFQGRLAAVTENRALFRTAPLVDALADDPTATRRTDTAEDHRYFPLDPADLHGDAVLFLSDVRPMGEVSE